MTESAAALNPWRHAYGEPTVFAQLKQSPGDFRVDEELGFELEGEGDHCFLHIEKTGLNTQAVAKHIAHLTGRLERDIGYAGMKDRHAITRQWFSVDMAGATEPDWTSLNNDQQQVIEVVRHRRKLRRGALKGNRFVIRLLDLKGDINSVAERMQWIATQGVPNYYGEQRFGRDNVARATAVFDRRLRVSRHQRGIYLSAARSWLFNTVLSQRVASDNWNVALDGDVMQLAGSHSVFKLEAADEEAVQRVSEFDIHPTGPLWGRGELMSSGPVRQLETDSLKDRLDLCQGLEAAGLKQERRALRLGVEDLQWSLSGAELTLSFELLAGSYATSVLREIASYQGGQ